MDAAALGLPVLVSLVAVALLFDFLNGLHDAANSIATVVATRVLRPQTAVIWAAFFNFIAFAVFGLHVAQTVGTGIVSALWERLDRQLATRVRVPCARPRRAGRPAKAAGPAGHRCCAPTRRRWANYFRFRSSDHPSGCGGTHRPIRHTSEQRARTSPRLNSPFAIVTSRPLITIPIRR